MEDIIMNFTRWFLTVFFFLMLVGTNMLIADFKKGETYYGFKLLEKRFVKEVNAECLYFEHIKSGARLLKIETSDPNKTFCIAFKTIPENDYGTPHIMEHSVLNGSKHFPVKSPFDVLSKGSLNTFLNAMTGNDITMYPVASMNDKDYFNLMHVYLDAVFYPLIYQDLRILKQEGWHYELENVNDPVDYKGVVYNEMKGAYSSPTRELNYQVYKNLFPDNGYAFTAGGYPPAIPSLTYEAFLNFHKKYYHPSNSYIYVYGNADLNKELEFIDKEYLANYNKEDVKIDIPLQKQFVAMKEIVAPYPVTEGSKTENQTYLTLNFVAGLNTDRELAMALNVLSDVLVNQEAAPIRLALQKAGIGQEVGASVDEIQQNVFQIFVQNANAGDKEKFKEIVMSTLREVLEKGLDKQAVEGSLNRMEFRLREGDDAQKGLTYVMQALPGWFFANDPFLTLQYEKPLAKVKTALQSDLLESIIKKYIIDNPHSLLLVLEPKPGMEKENNEKIENALKTYKSSLSEKSIDSLVKGTKELVDYQKREDTPEALAAIPLLDIKDINPKAEWYSIDEKKISDVQVLYREEFTNDVVYSRLIFDMHVLPKELIPYASLLAEFLGSLNTKNYSYGDLDKALNIHTGGFSTTLDSYLENFDDSKLEPKFIVESKAMNNKVDKMFELVTEIVNQTKYSDIDRLKEVLIRHQSRLDGNIKRNGFGYTRLRLGSYYSNDGMFDELIGGIEYYWFVKNLADHFEEKGKEISDNLFKTAELLFTKQNLIASVTCGKEDLPKYSKGFEQFIQSLPNVDTKYQQWAFNLDNKNEGFQTASKVQYVLKGYDFKKLGYKWSGKLRVLEQILSTDWLQNQVRVIGGAYGGFCAFSPYGRVYFASYRDPNLKETLDNYDATPDYLGKFEADEKSMTRYIIGTIANIDQPLTPSQKGNLAVKRFFEKTKLETVQKDRDEILATTHEDIRAMQKMVGDILAQKAICVYGNEEKIQTEKDLFKNIKKLD
jgi:Zn-dependent M16 (insulinase) family peptidase